MAATVYSVAANLFHAYRDDPAAIASIREAFKTAVSGALTKNGMRSITNATKNSNQMTMALDGLDEDKRATALRLALQYLDAGMVTPASRAFGRF